MTIIHRLIADESGQDMIEYALLSAFIGVAGAAVWSLIQTNMGLAYLDWNSNANNVWESPDPK